MGNSYQKFLDDGQADLISGLSTLCASAGAFIQVRSSPTLGSNA